MIWVLIGLTIVELGLRETLGFCHAVLYKSDKDYEYIAQPNQTMCRFGKRYLINSYSQRNDEPRKAKRHILGLGDSVIFGGPIDQDSLATTIFSQKTDIQMLNISGGSWGPDNVASYINKHGLFDAEALVLVVSSHDAYDNMSFKPVVGISASYPDKQYKLALFELMHRYIYGRIKKALKKKSTLSPDEEVLAGIRKDGKTFNSGFRQLVDIAKNNDIPLYVILHPELGEIKACKYNEQGEKIIEWCKENNVELTCELNKGVKKEMYRDNIHYNEYGQKFLCELMMQVCKKHFQNEYIEQTP